MNENILISDICPRCGEKINIPGVAYINAGTYHNTLVVISDCCGKAFWLRPVTKFQISEYNGDREEDDWGQPIKKVYWKGINNSK
jgi:hypothetical protein